MCAQVRVRKIFVGDELFLILGDVLTPALGVITYGSWDRFKVSSQKGMDGSARFLDQFKPQIFESRAYFLFFLYFSIGSGVSRLPIEPRMP